MDYETLINENKQLKENNERLEKELMETKEHLKKYTAPQCKKAYYEKNKDEIIQKVKKYKQNYEPTKEQKQKWARTAYLNKKAKMEKEKLENQNI